MIKCKITVIKRTFNKELVEEYVENDRKKNLGPCEVFREGQEFVTDVFGGMPQGFCPWAWDDLYKVLVGFAADGNFGMWSQNKNSLLSCCTDATRPVIFKVEKMEVETE